MVLSVRRAMIVPASVQGGANGCKVASHLRSSRDLWLQSAAMEKKSKGGVDNGKQGGLETVVTWQRATSESSISSIDSLPTGESPYSPSDVNPSSYRKARLGLHASESDDEPDSVQVDYKKLRRPFGGGVMQPHPASSFIADEAVPDHGSTPSDDGKDSSSRVKFMCSFGGKIWPRPSDGKLRYVGGDTKIIAVNRDTNFIELMSKMREVCGQPDAVTLKYQLPDEDLDALVSVSSDEDLQNMMEEYDKLESDGSSRLRVFLFPVDYDVSSHHIDPTGDLRNNEQRYVDAVNGIPEIGSRIRMESFLGGPPAYALENLMGLEVPESWSLPRAPDPVPVALLAAHDVASHIHRVPVAVPVSNITSRSNAPSAPSSAPSSPPLLPRPNITKLPVSDIHLSYQDAHMKLGAQYNVLLAEGNYQENESYGGSAASSGTSQHEPLYRSSDSRRGLESPPRKQVDSGHQDHNLRTEQRRLSETKVPRVASHGKLTCLLEHVELVPSSVNETQQLPDVNLPPAEIQRLLQQQQQSLHQAVWQHSIDSTQDSYWRSDLLQPAVTQNAVLGQQQQGYQQQLQSVLFRAGHPQGHDSVYRQGEPQQYTEEVLHQLPRAMSSHAMAPVGQSTSYHVGSAPSSPRLGFREVPSRHAPGPQQLPGHWPFNAPTFGEQPAYGKRLNYGEQAGRAFRVSNSPPKYREKLAHAEERLHRQQQTVLSSTESMHHEQSKSSQFLYETNPIPQQYDLLSRPQMPLYKGHNPFQEKLIPYQDRQEIGDARQHQLTQPGKEGQFLSGQQHLHALRANQRLDHQESLQSVEQMSGHSRYQDTHRKVAEWDSDEARLGFRGRPISGPLDEELLGDSGAPHQRETQQATYPGLNLPESSDDLLSASASDYSTLHKNDRLEHLAGSTFQFRPGMLPPSTLGGYTGAKARSGLVDSSLGPRFIARSGEPELLAPGGLRAGGIGQDVRPSVFEVNGVPHATTGMSQGLQLPSGSHRLMEERPSTTFNAMAQQTHNMRLGDNLKLGTGDIRWNGGLGPDDVRFDLPVQGRDSFGNLFEEHLQCLPNLAMSKGSRLSRPSSSTNIPALEEDIGDATHLQSYGTQCKAASLIDEDNLNLYGVQHIPAIENSLFTRSAARYAVPPLLVDTMPVTSASVFSFDPTPVGSPSSDYHDSVIGDDLPSIKTIATQVPSVEDDDSGGSTTTVAGSGRSDSNCGSGEHVGQLTLTQHLAEDMASCVLESTPAKGPQVEVKRTLGRGESGQEEDLVAEGQSIWPLENAPTLSPNLWENPFGDAELHDDRNNDEKPTVEKSFIFEAQEKLTSSHKEEDSEDCPVGPLEATEDTTTGCTGFSPAEAAAAEAIAHGLQTIKNADLEELRELGSGTFGTVYHGKWRGTDVAIKRIKASCFAGRPSEQERLIADFWREACNLDKLHHPNVVAFYGVVSDGPGGTLATVTEYMVNGSLKQVLQKKDRTIDRRKRLLIAMDSAFGMEYLHGKNIVHFDLKCENLLVNMRDPHRPICKVGDLGLSKVKHRTMVSGGVRGTLPWMAPELLNGSSSLVTEKVDVFSFAIVMWELLTGEEPYANMHYGAIIGGIVNNSLRPPIPSWCDPGWRSLMEKCWSADPGCRPSFTEIASELRAMADGLKPKLQSQQHSPAQA